MQHRPEEAEHPYEDQVDRHDIVEQPWHDQDQDAGDQRDQRANRDEQIHGCSLFRPDTRRVGQTYTIHPSPGSVAMSAAVSPLAGKRAPANLLVDIPKLVTAYYTERPDPSVPAHRVA